MLDQKACKKRVYVKAGYNKETCTKGSLVDTEEECTKANKAVGGTGQVFPGSRPEVPYGCSIIENGNSVFNTNRNGAAKVGYSSICSDCAGENYRIASITHRCDSGYTQGHHQGYG